MRGIKRAEGGSMKKVWCAVLLVLILAVPAAAGELKVGDTASDWSLPDADDRQYTMQDWEGKVLLINYNDPDEKDTNDHFNDAVKAKVNEGMLKETAFKGIGIADCKASWKPDSPWQTIILPSLTGRTRAKDLSSWHMIQNMRCLCISIRSAMALTRTG